MQWIEERLREQRAQKQDSVRSGRSAAATGKQAADKLAPKPIIEEAPRHRACPPAAGQTSIADGCLRTDGQGHDAVVADISAHIHELRSQMSLCQPATSAEPVPEREAAPATPAQFAAPDAPTKPAAGDAAASEQLSSASTPFTFDQKHSADALLDTPAPLSGPHSLALRECSTSGGNVSCALPTCGSSPHDAPQSPQHGAHAQCPRAADDRATLSSGCSTPPQLAPGSLLHETSSPSLWQTPEQERSGAARAFSPAVAMQLSPEAFVQTPERILRDAVEPSPGVPGARSVEPFLPQPLVKVNVATETHSNSALGWKRVLSPIVDKTARVAHSLRRSPQRLRSTARAQEQPDVVELAPAGGSAAGGADAAPGTPVVHSVASLQSLGETWPENGGALETDASYDLLHGIIDSGPSGTLPSTTHRSVEASPLPPVSETTASIGEAPLLTHGSPAQPKYAAPHNSPVQIRGHARSACTPKPLGALQHHNSVNRHFEPAGASQHQEHAAAAGKSALEEAAERLHATLAAGGPVDMGSVRSVVYRRLALNERSAAPAEAAPPTAAPNAEAAPTKPVAHVTGSQAAPPQPPRRKTLPPTFANGRQAPAPLALSVRAERSSCFGSQSGASTQTQRRSRLPSRRLTVHEAQRAYDEQRRQALAARAGGAWQAAPRARQPPAVGRRASLAAVHGAEPLRELLTERHPGHVLRTTPRHVWR
jgi:hypothetical protein